LISRDHGGVSFLNVQRCGWDDQDDDFCDSHGVLPEEIGVFAKR
jgi:uncharacterized membrane protein YjdF